MGGWLRIFERSGLVGVFLFGGQKVVAGFWQV
jgi:hypothetical protein